MKRTKRLLALVLAMMMAFAMLAMPAAAHGDEDEGIMPLVTVRKCTEPNCTGKVTRRTVTRYMTEMRTCEYCSIRHRHDIPYTVDTDECDTCSYYAEHHNQDWQEPGICWHVDPLP